MKFPGKQWKCWQQFALKLICLKNLFEAYQIFDWTGFDVKGDLSHQIHCVILYHGCLCIFIHDLYPLSFLAYIQHSLFLKLNLAAFYNLKPTDFVNQFQNQESGNSIWHQLSFSNLIHAVWEKDTKLMKIILRLCFWQNPNDLALSNLISSVETSG